VRIKFKKGKQKWLLNKAIEKAGSERKLKKILGIPNQSLNNYRRERTNIDEKRLNKILNFLGLNIKDIQYLIEKELEENWGRNKGGIELIKKHKENGTYEDYLVYLRKRGKKVFSKMQYEKFKKVGKYKYKTKRGEIVRNQLERDTADTLYSFGLDYQYEPYMKINNSIYFPDFRIGNLILECTSWKGYLKVNKLKKKLKDFEKENFNVRFIIPPEIKKFYKPFEAKIITDINQASVAQTIRALIR